MAGARFALERAWPTRAREKGWCRDRRTIYDWPHQRVLRRQRGLQWMSVLHNVVRGAQDGASPLPCKVAILPREVSFAARNYQNGLLAPLARDRGAPHRTQLVHPVTRAALRARIGQTIGSVGWLPPRHDGASPAMALGAALAGCPVGCPPSFPSCKSPPSNYPVTVTWVELHTLQHGEVWPNQGIDEKGTVM